MVAVAITAPAHAQQRCFSENIRGVVYNAGIVPRPDCRRGRRDFTNSSGDGEVVDDVDDVDGYG